jgi:peptidoglycan hydrolase-like protein with peptidoglycan-binding domain
MNKKKAKWTGSAVLAGGLVITGIAVGGSPAPVTHPKTKAAAAVTGQYANLDQCPLLSVGYRGGCVQQLQADLSTALHVTVPADGVFGQQTKQLVETFQQDYHVTPADGEVGPMTKAALDTALGITPDGQSAPATSPAVGPPVTTSPATAQPLQYVALGDSYSSGEGLDPFLPGTDTLTDTCHRSTQAYSQYVFPKPSLFEACSGQTEAALTS